MAVTTPLAVQSMSSSGLKGRVVVFVVVLVVELVLEFEGELEFEGILEFVDKLENPNPPTQP